MKILRSICIALLLPGAVALAQTPGSFSGLSTGVTPGPNVAPLRADTLNTAIGSKVDTNHGTLTNPTLTGGTQTGGDVSGQVVLAPGATAAVTLAALASKHLQIEGFTPSADGIHDDTAKIQAALNLAQSSGFNVVELGPNVYLANTASINVPAKVRLTCSGGGHPGEPGAATNYRTQPCTLLTGSNYPVTTNNQSEVDHLTLLNANYAQPLSMRQDLALAQAFAGAAITANGDNTSFHDMLILGYNQCVDTSLHGRNRLQSIYGDCTNGVKQSQSHDIADWSDMHMWPYLTAHTVAENIGRYPISGLADNGTHGVRVAFVGQAEPPVTNDRVCLTQTQGIPYSMRGCWPVTVIDSTHFDLQGAVWPGSGGAVAITLSTTAGSMTAIASSLDVNRQIGPGMLLTSSALTSGTLVTGVYQNTVVLSSPAASTATSASVQTAPQSSAGGIAVLDTDYRNGKAFSIDNSENSRCSGCFEFGHEIAWSIGAGTSAFQCTSCGFDGTFDESNTSIGIQVSPYAQANSFIGGYGDAKGFPAYLSETANLAPTIINGMGLSPGSGLNSSIALMAGSLTMTGDTEVATGFTSEIAFRGTTYIAAAAVNGLFVGNNFGLAKFRTQGGGAQANLTQTANVSGGGP